MYVENAKAHNVTIAISIFSLKLKAQIEQAWKAKKHEIIFIGLLRAF